MAKYPQPRRYSSGAWLGVRDSGYSVSMKPDEDRRWLMGSTNGWPDPSIGRAWGTRLGFRRIASGMTGVSSGTVGQGLMSFYASNGGTFPFAFVSGTIFSLEGGSSVDVTPAAGVTISNTAHRIYGIQYANTLIISDGVNRPWKVTSSVGANPLTGAYLTDAAGAWYGPPVVYYGKVFAINNANRMQIEWSEENDPDNGYDVNTWVLTQSDPDPIHALAATNDALYYFRQDSIGAIRGAVTPDFQTDGVHDGVDNTVGTVSPASVVVAGRYVYFADQHGRPYRIIPGAGVEPIWESAAETLGNGVAGNFAHVSAAFDPETGTVVFAHPINGSTALTLLVFDAESGRYYGTWTMPTGFATSQFRTLGVHLYVDDTVRTLHFQDQLGNLWGETPRSLDTYADNAGSGLAISRTITTRPLGTDPEATKAFDEVAVGVRGKSGSESYGVQHKTSRSAGTFSAEQVAAVLATTSDGTGKVARVGINAQGRYLIVKALAQSQERTAFTEVVVQAVMTDRSPTGR